MIVLTDLDGVIADWGHEWDRHAALYPELGLPLTRDQTSFDLTAGLDLAGHLAVNEIMEYPGFYAALRPMPRAIRALHEMVEAGYDVYIVTSPWLSNPTCASDKLNWTERYIGEGWGARTIITSDKTLVKGDILIDDKPKISGSAAPEWEHVWYTQPYNAKLSGKRRMNDWSEWRSIIEEVDVFS